MQNERQKKSTNLNIEKLETRILGIKSTSHYGRHKTKTSTRQREKPNAEFEPPGKRNSDSAASLNPWVMPTSPNRTVPFFVVFVFPCSSTRVVNGEREEKPFLGVGTGASGTAGWPSGSHVSQPRVRSNILYRNPQIRKLT